MAARTKKPAEIVENGTEPVEVVENATEPPTAPPAPPQRWATLTLELDTEEVMESLLRDRPYLFVGFNGLDMFQSLTGGEKQVVKMRKPIMERANGSEVAQ